MRCPRLRHRPAPARSIPAVLFPLFLIGCCLLGLVSAAAAVAQPAGARVAYLIDFVSQTLDFVELDTGTVQLGFLPVGAIPNQVRAHAGMVYVVNSLPERLQIIDPGGPVVDEVELGSGTNPWAIEIAGGKGYVSLWNADALVVVDLAAGVVLHQVDVGVSPEGMCVHDGYLYVANSGYDGAGGYEPGSVSVIDIATDDVVADIAVADNPQWCAVGADGNVYVVCSGGFGANAGQVDVIDSNAWTNTASLTVGGFPGPIAVASSGVAYMVEWGLGLLAIDTVTQTVLHDASNPIQAGGLGALGLAIDASDQVYVALSFDGILSIIAPDGTLAGFHPVGAGPQDVDLHEDGVTAVELAMFDAARRSTDVALTWRTGAEIDHLGFHVERRRHGSGGSYQRLTGAPLTSLDGRYAWTDRDAPDVRLEYRLLAVEFNGDVEVLGPFAIAAAAPVFAPLRVAPNPCRVGGPAVDLGFTLEHQGRVTVRIADVAGRTVRLLHDDVLAAGRHRLTWDGRFAGGALAPVGVYLAQVATPDGTRVAKLVLAR